MALNPISFSVTPQNPEPHFFIDGILYTYKDAGMSEIPQLDKVYLVPTSLIRLTKKNWFNASPLYSSKIYNFEWAELIIPFFNSEEYAITSVESKIKDFNFGFEFNRNFKNDCIVFNEIFLETLGHSSKETSEDGLFSSETLEKFKDKTVLVSGYVVEERFFNLTLISFHYEIKTKAFTNTDVINATSGNVFFLQKSNKPFSVDYNYINDQQQDLFKKQIKQLSNFVRPQTKKLKPFARRTK